MADEPQISILDARLAEIDRRLRTIQTGLADDVGAGPESGDRLPSRLAVPEPGGFSARARRPVALAPSEEPEPEPVPVAPEPAAAPPDPEPEAPEDDTGLVIAALRGLISDHARLLDAMGEVLASGERLLARAEVSASADDGSPSPVAPADDVSPSPDAPAAAGSPSQVTVIAGPFLNLETVRDFERTLGTLPNVASVQARGYEGGDRTVVDVHLSRPSP